VDVCATVSLFIHVTVVPTATFRSAGLNAPRPSTDAPTGMLTDDEAPPGGAPGEGLGDGVGDGDGDGVGDE
jgi:hypothetical protein